MNNDILLDVRGLKKYYPLRRGLTRGARGIVRSVDGVNFFIRRGETLGLIGESGCGKTTTARCILRAIDASAGQILYRHRDGTVSDITTLGKAPLRALRRDIQMVFQDPYSALNPRMTIHDIIAEPLKAYAIGNRRDREQRVAELLNRVGLRSEYMRRFPHAFSGGQRQRIVIARALALKPRLIVADEPVSALDVSVQAQVLNLLLQLRKKEELTYLFVAHDLSVVKHICDRVAVMYVGQIIESAPTDSLFERPRHPYTAALMAALPVADPRIRSKMTPLQGEVPNPANPPRGCYFHPRCRYAQSPCRENAPPVIEHQPLHYVSCHRAGELQLGGE